MAGFLQCKSVEDEISTETPYLATHSVVADAQNGMLNHVDIFQLDSSGKLATTVDELYSPWLVCKETAFLRHCLCHCRHSCKRPGLKYSHRS